MSDIYTVKETFLEFKIEFLIAGMIPGSTGTFIPADFSL